MVVLKYYFSTQNTKKHAALVALRLKILAPKHSKLPKIIAYCSYKVIKKKPIFLFCLSLSPLNLFLSLFLLSSASPFLSFFSLLLLSHLPPQTQTLSAKCKIGMAEIGGLVVAIEISYVIGVLGCWLAVAVAPLPFLLSFYFHFF